MKTLSIRAALQLGGATSILNHLVGKVAIDGTLSLRKAVESVQSALDRFFLDEIASKDLFFRGARRLSCAVEPLIDRAHALQAMERPIMEAQSTVFIAGWLFLPDTPLLGPDVRKIIGKEFDSLDGQKVFWPRTWLSLIRFVLEKKGVAVKVRIIISDFDPFFAADKHRLCWRAMSDLAAMRDKLPPDRRENLEFIGSMHGFFLNLMLVKKLAVLLFPVSDQIKSLVDEYNKMAFSKAIEGYRRTPGHWGSIRADLAKKRFSRGSSPEPRAFIATHHQKFCVIDGKIACCGGMDVTPHALDTMSHDRSRSNWHDIHSLVKGEVVTDIERNFRERWNVEGPAFSKRVTELEAVKPDKGVLRFSKLTEASDPGRRADKTPGTDVVQALRTVSVDQPGQFLPEVKRADIRDAYSRAIDAAQNFIYLENQYFRAPELTELLIARHRKVPRLQVILVIPIAPEELSDPKSADARDLHPVAVQIKEIERLIAALGLPNFGIFSLVVRAKARKKNFTDAHGSPQLYVHSKICIVDDLFATIGSANINGRSLEMDTELNIGWLHSKRVRDFRLKLWRHLLGSARSSDIDTWAPDSFTERWRKIAELNAKDPPASRGGLVIPHNLGLLKGVAKTFPLIPETFINIHEVLPQPAPRDLIELDESRDDTRPPVS